MGIKEAIDFLLKRDLKKGTSRDTTTSKRLWTIHLLLLEEQQLVTEGNHTPSVSSCISVRGFRNKQVRAKLHFRSASIKMLVFEGRPIIFQYGIDKVLSIEKG